jgi:NADH-quinone oxidoreductase subunit H
MGATDFNPFAEKKMDNYVYTMIKIGGVAFMAINMAAVLVWMERRFSALMQDRVGPHRANLKLGNINITLFGLLHPVADALKILWKEDFVPAKANRLLHAMSPFLAMMPVLICFAVVPFGGAVCPEGFDPQYTERYGPYIQSCLNAATNQSVDPTRMLITDLDIGMLLIFAISSLAVYGIAIAGWSSYNNYALLGSLRASAQMISYEVTLGLSVMGVFLLASSLSLDHITGMQGAFWGGILNKWGIFLQPLAFILFFTAAIAETKRVPFDNPEGESEIQGGYMLEFSSSRFFMFFLGELVEIVFVGCVVTAIFLGGWATLPLPIGTFYNGLPLEDGTLGHGILWAGGGFLPLGEVLTIVAQILSFFTKMFVFAVIQMTIRWTLPRFRYDQVMTLCWKVLLPLSLANVLITAVVAYFLY